MRSNLVAPENQEQESTQPGLRLQNGKMLKVELNGDCLARQGSMVAFQGQVHFEALGSGGTVCSASRPRVSSSTPGPGLDGMEAHTDG